MALIGEVSALRQEVRELKATKTKAPKALLSLRQTAARLGVDRNTTLRDIIANGQLETVQVNGKTKVPASEVDRLASQGFDSTVSKATKKKVAKTAKTSQEMTSAVLAWKPKSQTG